MNDENKTIADLLKTIDDKTVDRSEVMPMLKSIERNTAKNIGSAVGSAVTKAMDKHSTSNKTTPPAVVKKQQITIAKEAEQTIATIKKRKEQTLEIPGVIKQAKAVAASAIIPVKKTNYASTTPAVISRDVSGKFTSKTTGTDGVAEQKQDSQADKLSSILKDAVGSKKETIKDTAGRMAMGPFYDIGKELLEATGSMRDNANDEKSTMGRLKNWGQAKMGIKPKKAEAAHDKAQAKHDKVEAASDKAEAKHDQLQAKLDKAKQGAKVATATGTAIMGGGGGEDGGGILSTLAGTWLGGKTGGVLGKVATKIPMLGKLFPSLAAGGAAAGVAGSVAASAAPAVAGAGGGMFSGIMAKAGGLASKIPGAGMLGKIGGRIPLLGGLIAGGVTLAQGGSKSEAVGSGVGTTAGAMAGGALGSLLGPVGTVAGAALGGIAGDWIGTKLGGLFNNQNKADSDKVKQQQEILKSQGEQQQGFWDKMAGSSNPLLAGIGNLVGGVKNSVSAAGSAYSQVRERGGGFMESIGAGIKGGFKASKGKALGREQQLEQAAVSSGMTNPKELAMFMAQAKHETAGFNTMEEYASGANYEGRKDLGNTQAGDGKRFKGRGYFQLTGRANYADMSNKVGADLVNNPELAEDPAIAAKIALQYWKDKKLSAAAQAGDAKTVTKRINGGMNGYDDRVDNLQGYNTKYAKGVPGATVTHGTPGTQAAPTQVTSATGTANKNTKVGKNKKKMVPLAKAKIEQKTADAKEENTAEQTGQIQAAGPATSEIVPTPPATATGKVDYAAKAEKMLAAEDKTLPETKSALGSKVEAMFVKDNATLENPVTGTTTIQKSVDTAQGATVPAVAAATNKPAMTYDEQKTARDQIGTEYWSKEEARRAQSGEAFKSVKEQQAGITAEKDSKLSDIETRRTALEAKYDAGGLTDEEAGKQQMALDAEGEQVKKEHSSKMGNAISSGFKTVDAQSGQLLDEKEAKEKALDAQIAGTVPVATTVAGQAQPATVPAMSAVQTPLPQPQVAQAAPPPPVEVPGLEKLAKSQEQQASQQASNSNSGGGSTGLPNIKTEFDDTMLTLMVYDRV